jgi:superfamily II DNA or RNA helicase
MIQSLVRRDGVDLSRYGYVIVDECHHVPAVSIERLLREIPARHLTGLTATPQRRDGHHPILSMQCGPRVVLATGRYIGEGFDDSRLDTLMLAMPIAWKGTMTQYAGRLHRHHDAKHEIRIIDYVDHEVPVLRRMFAKRQRAYTRLGYCPG